MTIAVAITAVIVGCGAEPVAPGAAPSLERMNFTQRRPIAGTAVNPCPPAEPVAYEGFVVFNQHADVEPGRTDVMVRAVVHGNGIGLLTGSRYVLQQNQHSDQEITTTPFTRETESRVYTRLIRQGSEDNSYFQVTFTQVCDATGCRFVERDQERVCRG